MHQKKEGLEELSKRIEEERELGDFYEERFLDKKDKGDEVRFYFCRANQYRLLVQKTENELNDLLSKFDIHRISFLKFCLLKTGCYNGSISELKQKIEGYSFELKKYEEKTSKLYETKTNDSSLKYNPREKIKI